MPDNFLHYFNQELANLRKLGSAFAKAHPKIAKRLNLGAEQVEDPFVGRLLEGFAFLTARIQQQYEQGPEIISRELLNLLFPHYLLPIPSISIIQFIPHKELEQTFTIPRHTTLTTTSPRGIPCQFRTCYSTPLLPLQIDAIELYQQSHIQPLRNNKLIKSTLTIKLSTQKHNGRFQQLNLDNLRFFIKSEPCFANLFLELLFTKLDHVLLSCGELSNSIIELDKRYISQVGFKEDESLLAYPNQCFTAYQSLSEYFAYPEKFLFFEINTLNNFVTENFHQQLHLHFFFRETDHKLQKIINRNFLLLNCTPIINLFETDGELIHYHREQTEIHLIPSYRTSAETVETYRILDITAHRPNSDQTYPCLPYFGDKYSSLQSDNKIYWTARRKHTDELGNYHLSGTETFVIFSECQSSLSEDYLIMHPKLLCSNREIPNQFTLDGSTTQFNFWDKNYELVNDIVSVSRFSLTQYRHHQPAKDNELLSHLALHQLCFDDANSTLHLLKNLLSLYHFEGASTQLAINSGLVNATTKRVALRHPDTLRYGFCYGVELTLEIDESYFPDNDIFLFGSILNHLLTQLTSINNISYLVLTSNKRGEIYRWKPNLGAKANL